MLFTILPTVEDNDDRRTALKIYKCYSSRMKNYAYSILRNEHDAEDAVQETMIKIIKNIKRFVTLSEYETEKLVMVYLRNVAITIYRKNKSQDEQSFSFDDAEDMLAEDDVWEHIMRKELTAILNKTIEQIPKDYRDFLILFYNYGHTLVEIGEIFGITEDNAKMKLMRARKALRKKWREENNEDFGREDV